MNTCQTNHKQMCARAIKIADESMIELLCAHSLRVDEHGVIWALQDANGNDVSTLAEADMPLIEAVNWLQERKLCDLVESPRGAMVFLFTAIEESRT